MQITNSPSPGLLPQSVLFAQSHLHSGQQLWYHWRSLGHIICQHSLKKVGLKLVFIPLRLADGEPMGRAIPRLIPEAQDTMPTLNSSSQSINKTRAAQLFFLSTQD